MAVPVPALRASIGGLRILAAGVLSWAGLCLHNIGSLPDQTLLSPETLYPSLVYLLCAAGWFSPWRLIAARVLLAWGWLNLVGGAIISILPSGLGDPLSHYAFHVLYGVLQIPLLVMTTRYLRQARPLIGRSCIGEGGG